jgi:arsenate reductase-like glutaredoxin family protein
MQENIQHPKSVNFLKKRDKNIIELVRILTGGTPISKSEIVKILKTSERSVERLFQTIKENYKELLLIKKKVFNNNESKYENRYQLIRNERHLPKPLQKQFQRSNKKKRTNIFYDENLVDVISFFRSAINEKKIIRLTHDIGEEFRKTFDVLPIKINLSRTISIEGICRDDNKREIYKVFELSEHTHYLIINPDTKFKTPNHKPDLDDFNLYDEENPGAKPMEAKLILTRVSYDLTLNLLPHLISRIEDLNQSEINRFENQTFKFSYKLNINFYNIQSLGSLISGKLNHFKVITSNEVIDLLKNYIEQNITNKIESSLIIE